MFPEHAFWEKGAHSSYSKEFTKAPLPTTNHMPPEKSSGAHVSPSCGISRNSLAVIAQHPQKTARMALILQVVGDEKKERTWDSPVWTGRGLSVPVLTGHEQVSVSQAGPWEVGGCSLSSPQVPRSSTQLSSQSRPEQGCPGQAWAC